ncbi:MAG: triose-phosphate isomerase [Dehalococcoidia bacterium]|nr:triose-phosphate isomerase [Dehalococcoidia bacterium]
MKNKSYISTVVANWKMHNDFNAALDLVIKIFSYCNMVKNVEKIICPPVVNIIPLYDQFKNSTFSLGAQNINENSKGSFTGEISVNMLKNYISHAIIGHSERRVIFNESNHTISLKAKALLDNKIVPIICVGEPIDVYKKNKSVDFINNQLFEIFSEIQLNSEIVIAYEPIWSIGNKNPADPIYVEKIITKSKDFLCTLKHLRNTNLKFLYGGSVSSKNVLDYTNQKNIDGVLVGSASLDASEFGKIVLQISKNG